MNSGVSKTIKAGLGETARGKPADSINITAISRDVTTMVDKC
jgi:hypothetical protein